MDRLPPCATWSIWTGKEIEGNSDLGVETLFVRDFSDYGIHVLKEKFFPKITRIWLCKEIIQRALREQDFLPIYTALTFFETVCLEVPYDALERIPMQLRYRCKSYIKFPFELLRGECICLGKPFQDEAFEIGEGRKVNPDQYAEDTKFA